MEKSKSGDSKAFSDLSAVIRDISYSYFLSKHRAKKIINIDDVDDLTNNVYLAFAEQFQVIENAENWLRRVLFLTFVRWYKRSKSRISCELSDRIPASEEITKEFDFIDAGTALEVLDTLSAEKQEIVKLRFWADLKFSEIAEKLNKNEAAVKKMFYRTLLEIKENLE
jgi:RNA polymerase sigma-70 factor (ECF subfamily)